MSPHTIFLSKDIKRLQDAGFMISFISDCLVVNEIPYVESGRVDWGSIICSLETNGEETVQPTDHTVFWTGARPNAEQIGMHKEGRDCVALAFDTPQIMADKEVRFQLSIKPYNGVYNDYYEKITAYANILSRGVKRIDPNAAPRRLVVNKAESPFVYGDGTAEVRGSNAINKKLKNERIAIIGTGGTGSYILDYVAKCPVAEIHIYDDDRMKAHNGYRIPGTISVEELKKMPYKVEWLAEKYRILHRCVYGHPEKVSCPLPDKVCDATFVFLSMDIPSERGAIIDALISAKIPFIYVGINVELRVDEHGEAKAESGMQCSLFAPEDGWTPDEVKMKLNVGTVSEEQREVYGKNVQIVELNAMNAGMAVIQWKKYRECYVDHYKISDSIYEVGMQVLTRRRKTDG